jgi:hypothetical protein
MIYPFEVVKYSSAKQEMDTKWINTQLRGQVFMFFKTYVSKEAYRCMISHLVPVINLVQFSFGTDYLENAHVQWDGVIYKKLADGGSNQIVPFNNPQYAELNRFDNAFLNTLWVDHLRQILAEAVFNASIIPATYQVSSKGAQKSIDTGTGDQAVKKDEMSLLKDAIDVGIYGMIELMSDYIEEKKDLIPCMEWKQCWCGDDEGPINNESNGNRVWNFLGEDSQNY